MYLEHHGKFCEIEKTARTLTTRSGRVGSNQRAVELDETDGDRYVAVSE